MFTTNLKSTTHKTENILVFAKKLLPLCGHYYIVTKWKWNERKIDFFTCWKFYCLVPKLSSPRSHSRSQQNLFFLTRTQNTHRLTHNFCDVFNAFWMHTWWRLKDAQKKRTPSRDTQSSTTEKRGNVTDRKWKEEISHFFLFLLLIELLSLCMRKFCFVYKKHTRNFWKPPFLTITLSVYWYISI